MGPQIFPFWLVVMVTAKMLFSLILWQPPLRVKNLYSSTENQNINLINSPSFQWNWLLFLKIKCHKWYFPQWLLKSLGIAIRAKILNALDFHFILIHFIKIWSILLSLLTFGNSPFFLKFVGNPLYKVIPNCMNWFQMFQII